MSRGVVSCTGPVGLPVCRLWPSAHLTSHRCAIYPSICDSASASKNTFPWGQAKSGSDESVTSALQEHRTPRLWAWEWAVWLPSPHQHQGSQGQRGPKPWRAGNPEAAILRAWACTPRWCCRPLNGGPESPGSPPLLPAAATDVQTLLRRWAWTPAATAGSGEQEPA